MEGNKTLTDERLETSASFAPETAKPDWKAQAESFKEKWKRALAEAENARKRADAAQMDGRDHGIALAVEALAPVYDDICLAIERVRSGAHAGTPMMAAYLDGMNTTKLAFETGLKALGIRQIAPRNAPFDPVLHEALQTQETDEAEPGEVLVLHRPGFAKGQRLIRPAHVTVSASPTEPPKT